MQNVNIAIPDLCQKHQWLLVKQARYKETDPWRALVIITNIALFQAVTSDGVSYARIGGDVARIGELGCLACHKPDAFGQIVEAAKTRELGAIKALGERWVEEGQKRGQTP